MSPAAGRVRLPDNGVDKRKWIAGHDIWMIGIKPVGIRNQSTRALDRSALIGTAADRLAVKTCSSHKYGLRASAPSVVLEHRGVPAAFNLPYGMAIVDPLVFLTRCTG